MNIAILGYGKMGKTIEQLATGHQIILKITEDNADQLTIDNLRRADVAIEFTQPDAAFENIKLCINAGIPVVSGTTGWLDKLEEIKALIDEKNGAFFYAPNFSIGVNLFFALNRVFAKWIDQYEDYEILIEEIHHTEKKDAPSGTAIRLAEEIIHQMRRKDNWIHQDYPKSTDLLVTSKRIVDTPGTHTVTYQSKIDKIQLQHVAFSREGFAKGALLAAEWIVGKQGLFGMEDLMGMR